MEWLRTYCERHWLLLLLVLFPLVSLGMHLHLLDLPLQGVHAWRQCETASNVVLYAERDYGIMDPHVYSLEWDDGLKRMEFPLMQWAFGQVIKVFGHEIFVMRFMSWLLAMVTLLGFYKLCHLLLRDRFQALAATWCWMFSPLLFYYGINPLPDNLSLLAAVWGTAFFLQWFRTQQAWALIVCFLFLALATATKLPFVVFFALPMGGLLQKLIANRGQKAVELIGLGFVGLLILAPALWWYAWVIPQWTGNGVVKGILDSSVDDIPDMLGILGQSLISTLPELLINYAALGFFIWGLVRIGKERLYRHTLALPFGLLALGIAAYFVFEINMITTVHDYYLFPFMPGLMILVALGVQGLARMPQKWVGIAIIVILLALPITAALRCYPRWGAKGMSTDLLAHEQALREATPADAKIIYCNDLSPHIALFHLHRNGWSMDESAFNAEKFNLWLGKGARYLYSDSRNLEVNPVVQPHLGKLIGEWGKLWVWELQ